MIRQGIKWFNLETETEIVWTKNLFYIFTFQNMACLLQPECNFLHSFFRCKLLVEEVDVEVKITSMQGTHIFRRDQTTQLIKCTPWNTRLCPHPTIIKKMKTFLEVEGKMGLIPASQFRPPLPNTNSNIRKDNDVEKGKRVAPKRSRPSTPKPTTMHLPLPETPPKAKTDVPDSQPQPLVPVHESTPWPGTDKMSGNLFEDRKWTMPMKIKLKMSTRSWPMSTSPRPPIKEDEEPKINEQSTEKCSWGPDCPFCKSQEKKEEQNKVQTAKDVTQTKTTKATG